MAKSNQKKSKDVVMPLVIGFTLLMLVVIGFFIVSPILEKIETEEYRGHLAESVNSTKGGEPAIVTYQGETMELDEYGASWLYAYLMSIGQGIKATEKPEGDVMEFSFPDDAKLTLGSVKIQKGNRKGRDGLYLYYEDTSGLVHEVYYDMANFWKFRNEFLGE